VDAGASSSRARRSSAASPCAAAIVETGAAPEHDVARRVLVEERDPRAAEAGLSG